MRELILCGLLIFAIDNCDGNNRVKRIVGGEPAQLPPPDDPTVYLHFAGKAAAVKGVLDQPHYVFRGIRYGLKPTGKDRFQRPRQYFLQGNEDATLYPPPCIQGIPGDNKVIGSEDCLFLNVFTPDLPDGTEGLPVVVWIHGGGFRYGSASQYGVRNLVGQRVVVVTIQYRLGSLGFLSTGTAEMPGNAALWDMALAVQWVRNYIGFFGGNPHRIVVMGHGTGASSALMVALSKIAKGTISAAVAMSGTAISQWAIENNPDVNVAEVADYHGCPTTPSILPMIKCLQSVPSEHIVEGDTEIAKQRLESRGFVVGLNGILGSSPNAEGGYDGRALPPVIENKPEVDLVAGNIPKIPVLVGVTKDETKNAIQDRYKDEIINKLKTIPNFLDKVLIKNLQGITSFKGLSPTQVTSYFQALNPLQFRNYIQIPKNNIVEGLNRIAEATNDALFNLPAFLTAELWTKRGAKAFLYRFEHAGNARKGNAFLHGSPLVSNNTSARKDVVAHGDDLAYLFEARNLDGSPLDEPENLTAEDLKVRAMFTKMIADFARTGELTVNDQKVEPFSGTSNNYVQIDSKPKVQNNFRYCEMALWAGLVERLRSKSCEFLNAFDTSLKSAENLFFDTAKAPQNAVSNVASNLNPLNVFGGGGGKKQAQQSSTAKNNNNMIPPLGFLG